MELAVKNWRLHVIMKTISFIILAVCLPLFVVACGKGPTVAEVGKPAPDFALIDRTGQVWTLSELRGQVVFVNFWATWCPPCREEMPSMQKLQALLPADRFKMLAILHKDDPKLADIFAKRLGLTMPILHDQDTRVGIQYGLTGVPETFIVDKQGVIRQKFIGPAQWDSPQFVQMMMNYINQ
jgi:cytochrome c biogenesis protein CcmG, thiol:disulfide interchange protein DsbE